MSKKKLVIGKKDALTIVDGQNDFLRHDGALYVAGVTAELSTNFDIYLGIERLGMMLFGHRATTEDEHPENHVEYNIFGKHCAQGTEGQKYHPDVRTEYEYADEHLKKGQHPAIISYSVATSPQFPEHIANLRKKGIKRVFIVGWAYTHCVGESAIAYACQGFETFVIRDLTKSVPPPYGDPVKMKKKLALYSVKEVLSNDIE